VKVERKILRRARAFDVMTSPVADVELAVCSACGLVRALASATIPEPEKAHVGCGGEWRRVADRQARKCLLSLLLPRLATRQHLE
jgi:hypothetical protein